MIKKYLDQSSKLHRHLCPRQVLGVRMALLAKKMLQLELPQEDKRLIVIVETDGCAVDGIAVVTGCSVGHRTLRIEDYGKIAATFVDSLTRQALRIVPRKTIREHAYKYALSVRSKWEAQLLGYQRMPDDELLEVEHVELVVPIDAIISSPGKKTICRECGEEIHNEREVVIGGLVICKSCAGEAYCVRVRGDESLVRNVPTLCGIKSA